MLTRRGRVDWNLLPCAQDLVLCGRMSPRTTMTDPHALLEALTALGRRAEQVSGDWEGLTGTRYDTLGGRVAVRSAELYGLVDAFSEAMATLRARMAALDRAV